MVAVDKDAIERLGERRKNVETQPLENFDPPTVVIFREQVGIETRIDARQRDRIQLQNLFGVLSEARPDFTDASITVFDDIRL
jgi:hypothetical protein